MAYALHGFHSTDMLHCRVTKQKNSHLFILPGYVKYNEISDFSGISSVEIENYHSLA
jgi:hypothetical protein